MSTCLFTIRPESLKSLSIAELEESLTYWKTHIDYTSGNKFEVDRAHGFMLNIFWGELELLIKKNLGDWTREGLGHRVCRDGLPDILVMHAAYLLANRSSDEVCYLKLTRYGALSIVNKEEANG